MKLSSNKSKDFGFQNSLLFRIKKKLIKKKMWTLKLKILKSGFFYPILTKLCMKLFYMNVSYKLMWSWICLLDRVRAFLPSPPPFLDSKILTYFPMDFAPQVAGIPILFLSMKVLYKEKIELKKKIKGKLVGVSESGSEK